MFFSPSCIWNAKVPVVSPLDPASAASVAKIGRWIAKSPGYINTVNYSAPIYTVPAGAPVSDVILDWNNPPLNNAFKGVPIPANALAAGGTDEHMVIWQPSSDTMWEFWKMRQALQAVPGTPAATTSAGGALPAGSYSYKVTAINAAGETLPTPAHTLTVPGSGKVNVSWRGVIGATGYKVYRGPSGGVLGLIATVPTSTSAYGTTVAYVDAGGQPGAAPPTVNTAVTPGVWHAGWGGRIIDVSQSPGHYRRVPTTGVPIIEDPSWGSTACSLPMAAGLSLITELQAGLVPHAIGMALPDCKKGTWVYPAQRTDGQDASIDAIPEGARFRIDPALDITKLGLPPVTLTLAKAAQDYGIIVNDRTLASVGFRCEDPTPLMRAGQPNPYTKLFVDGAGKPLAPYQVLMKFPWASLQQLAPPMNPL